MTHHDQEHDETQVPGGKPSQAEGDRRDDEQNEHDETQVPGGKPSQAEGDRETVEQELGEQ